MGDAPFGGLIQISQEKGLDTSDGLGNQYQAHMTKMVGNLWKVEFYVAKFLKKLSQL